MRLELRLSAHEPMDSLTVVLVDEHNREVAMGHLEVAVEPEAGELEPRLPVGGEGVRLPVWFVGTAVVR